MNRIGILEGLDYSGFAGYGAPTRRRRRKKRSMSKKQRAHMKRFGRAARVCGRTTHTKRARAACMRKKLKKGRR